MKEWVDGGLRVFVPLSALTSTGLRVSESVIPGYSPVLSGNPASVESAERCIAKRVGENCAASLVGFDAPTRRAIFALEKSDGASETTST